MIVLFRVAAADFSPIYFIPEIPALMPSRLEFDIAQVTRQFWQMERRDRLL
ncbi:hypothetical protein [Coleofasciculus sp. H7-2]|uniref:hypothetical protein n=1 Tax=Coleofasciculus sp. H7-2 TaxID=3351545 RepID=UPI00366B13A2